MEKTSKQNSEKNAILFCPELLSMYYSRLFPFELLHKWLSYNPKNDKKNVRLFSKREFSFTIDLDGDDVLFDTSLFRSRKTFEQQFCKENQLKLILEPSFRTLRKIIKRSHKAL